MSNPPFSSRAHAGLDLQQRFADVEPNVRAFLEEPDRFARIEREAAASPGGPLAGVTLGVKDIIHVDGLPTRAGSLVPPQVLQGAEASCVTKLKQAGAVVVGKTVTTEFAWFAPGPTRNPHNLDYTPGGSSSGSAAAVAAELCDLALGTQTGGSTIRPASFCGVVGFKPTFNRIAIDGVIPFSVDADTVGLFARDLPLVMRAAAVVCNDWQPPNEPPASPVLGIPEGPYLDNAGDEGLALFEAMVDRLTRGGLTVKRVAAMPDHDDIAARHHDMIAAGMADVHRDWIVQYGRLYKPQTRDLIEHGRAVSDERLAESRQGRAKLRGELAALMDEHHLDAWICPASAGVAPRGIDTTGSPVMNVPWTHAQVPAISLPGARDDAGLPMGLQITARHRADETLLAIAAVIAPLLT